MKKIELPLLDEALLAECKIDTFRSSGAGGQHVNVTDSAVRLTHLPSGLVVTSQSSRSQHMNKLDCLEKLRAKVKKLNYRKPPRVRTRIPKSVKAKNAQKKRGASAKKQLRQKPRLDD